MGGRPAATFAKRLMLPVSNDTLLRVVRRRGSPRFVPPTVIGIDDWAWRRNQRYGTIICDLERRKTIALLPDREPSTAQAWLSDQPQISIVARDRSGGYATAAAKALPHATQVADRWHLMENASRAFLDAVRKSMRQIRTAQWTAGNRNGTELWRQLKSQGFRGCLRVVTEWATRRRKAEKVDAGALSRAPSARTIARLMTIGRDDLSKSETVTVAAIEGGVPLLVEAREVIAAFQAMIRKKSLADLDTWLERARSGLVASFANGVVRDRAAVSAAISSPWSNGQTEGQITKLKLVKRQMYGRGKIDLLQARVIGAG